MFIRGSNNSPRSIQLDEIRLSNSSFEHLLRDHDGGETGTVDNDDHNSLNYELGFEDEVKLYDYDSSGSETSSILERRMAGLSFGIMFPVALVFGPCLSKGCRKLKRRFMMRFGKHFGRKPGISRRPEAPEDGSLFGIQHDFEGSTARTTGADHGPGGPMNLHTPPPPSSYRPVTITDIEQSKANWDRTGKQEWKRRRTTTMVRGEL